MEIKTKDKLILLVEDNIGHIRLIQEALKENQKPHHLASVKNGIDALLYLRQEGEYKNAVRPDIILLDLNLPRKDGREVLAEIKNDPKIKHIPVIVITTSNSEEDILKSYDLHVNCYITKSRNINELFKIVQMIQDFWLEIATLPPE